MLTNSGKYRLFVHRLNRIKYKEYSKTGLFLFVDAADAPSSFVPFSFR